MKTNKTTLDRDRKAFCDLVVERASAMMQQTGVPPEMVIDRFLSYGAALACQQVGDPMAAALFRQLAEGIEAGVIHSAAADGGRTH